MRHLLKTVTATVQTSGRRFAAKSTSSTRHLEEAAFIVERMVPPIVNNQLHEHVKDLATKGELRAAEVRLTERMDSQAGVLSAQIKQQGEVIKQTEVRLTDQMGKQAAVLTERMDAQAGVLSAQIKQQGGVIKQTEARLTDQIDKQSATLTSLFRSEINSSSNKTMNNFRQMHQDSLRQIIGLVIAGCSAVAAIVTASEAGLFSGKSTASDEGRPIASAAPNAGL